MNFKFTNYTSTFEPYTRAFQMENFVILSLLRTVPSGYQKSSKVTRTHSLHNRHIIRLDITCRNTRSPDPYVGSRPPIFPRHNARSPRDSCACHVLTPLVIPKSFLSRNNETCVSLSLLLSVCPPLPLFRPREAY